MLKAIISYCGKEVSLIEYPQNHINLSFVRFEHCRYGNTERFLKDDALNVSIEILRYMMKTAGQYICWTAQTNQCFIIQ